MNGWHRLRTDQARLLRTWFPDAEVVADHSWDLTGTTVLDLRDRAGRYIVKAADREDPHIAREVRAHHEWTAALATTAHSPRLLHGDIAAGVLVTAYLPGRLVLGDPAQEEPEIFRQAGQLLARLHDQDHRFDPAWHNTFRARAQGALDAPHRIDPIIAARARREIADWPGGGADVVPTHGDWQPRNWLIDGDTVRVIDYGRAQLRPRSEDLVRLARQDFVGRPDLEAAFLSGYGVDPRTPGTWRRHLVGEAIGTAVWAYRVGDEQFERLGHRLLAQLYPRGGTALTSS